MRNDNDFVIANVLPDQLNTLVKKIMAQTGVNNPSEAVRMVNDNEARIVVVGSKWVEKDGVIYFSVFSDGTTGAQWISRFKSNGFMVSDYAQKILYSQHFQPTNKITYKIAVLKSALWNDGERITKIIRQEAEHRHLKTPNIEVACLIREKFSDKELMTMGLYWIVTMHEPIKLPGGRPEFLDSYSSNDGSWLRTCHVCPGERWLEGGGFAFTVLQF